MKKIIVLSFVLATMIILGINNVNSSVRNNNNLANGGYIHYQVNIHKNWAITHNSCPMMVSITDRSNVLIGLPQLYHQNINTYDFYEIGPVSGIRKATITTSQSQFDNNACYAVSLSDSKSGTFYNGGNYVFDLYGSVRNIVKQDNSTVTQ